MTARFVKKQEHILTVARRIVSDGGFHDLQMLTVASVAGVSVGSVYRYFSCKAELCAALGNRVSGRELEVIEAALQAEGGPAARLASAVTVFARRALRNPRLAYALIAEPVDQEVDKVRLENRAAISRAFERVIAEGMREGVFRPTNPQTAAACVVGAFMEALVGPLAPEDRDRADREALVEDLSELCVAMLAFRSSDPVALTRPTNTKGSAR